MSNRMDQNRKKYGYARVSSKSQEANSSLESQKQELVRNGILESNIIIEVGSAANEIKNRPYFHNLIQNVLKEGDTLVVTKIDRCARNTLEFLKLQDILFKRKIQFISLDLPYSEDLNINKLISITLSSIAEFETNRRKERQMQGISAAKKAGRYRGRKTVIDDKLISEVKHLKQQKMLSVTQIVKITGRSRNTIYKVLKEHLGYVSNRLVKQDHKQKQTNAAK
jgi:DNA invertase Pin-like site-specific DNA recombinase